MKKNFIAKLLVLALALAMLPTAAFAAKITVDAEKVANDNGVYWFGDQEVKWDADNNTYYYDSADTNSNVGGGTPAVTTPSTSVDTEVPDVIDTIEEITADQVAVTADETTVTLKATVEGGVASVAMTEAAVESLAEQVKGSVLTIVVKADGADKVAVSLPGKALAALAEKTGADLVVKSPVATITIPNVAMVSLFKNVTNVAVMAEVNKGVYVIAVMADGNVVNNKIDGLVVKF